jgi:hypothetical protein
MKRGEEGQRKRGGEYMYEEDGTQIKKDEEGKRKAGGSLPLRKGTINGTEDY